MLTSVKKEILSGDISRASCCDASVPKSLERSTDDIRTLLPGFACVPYETASPPSLLSVSYRSFSLTVRPHHGFII